MVDRGGLDYTIRTRNEFTRDFARLRREILLSRQAIARLKTDMRTIEGPQATSARRGITAEEREGREARRQAAAESRRQDRETLDRLRRIQAAQRQRTENERLRARILQAQRQEAARLARAEAASARAAEQSSRRRASASQRALGSQRALTSEVRRSQVGINRLGFSLQRFFVIFGAFTAVRGVGGLFTDLISGSIQFSDFIERSSLSVGGLIQNLTNITDPFGEVITGAEGFEAALEEGRRQTALLQRDSLRTVATLEELQFAFQTALAPGFAAGLNIDEVRQFAIQASQAATAIGLEQNQLQEEVRSILQGTVQGRTTRLAAVFGGSPAEINANIRQAREQGRLFEFLTESLGGFDRASQRAAETFSGLSARLRDSVQFTGGIASEGLLGNLRTQLQDLLDLFIEIPDDPTAAVLPRPGAVALLTTLFDGLSGALTVIRQQFDQLDFSTLLAGANGLSGIFQGLAAIVGGFVRGVVDGFGLISSLVGQFSDSIGGISLDGIAEVARLVAVIGTVLISSSAAASLLTAAIRLAVGPFRLLVTLGSNLLSVMNSIGAAIARIPTRLLALAGGIAIAATIFKSLVDQAAGFEVRIGTLIRILREGFTNVLVLVAAQIRSTFLGTLVGTVQNAFFSLFADIAARAAVLAQELAESIGAFAPATAAQLDGLAASFGSVAASSRQAARGIQQDQAELAAAVEEAAQRVITDFDAALAEDADAASLSDLIASATDGLRGQFEGLIGEEVIDFEGIRTRLESAVAGGGNTFTGRVAAVTDDERDSLATDEAKLAVLQAQAEAAGLVAEASVTQIEAGAEGLAREQGRLGVLQAQLQVEREKARIQAVAAQRQVDAARLRPGAEAQLAEIESLRAATNGRITQDQLIGLEAGQQLELALARQEVVAQRSAATEAQKTAELARQLELVRQQRLILEGTVGEGLVNGLENFVEQFSSAFTAASNIAQGFTQNFSNGLATAINNGLMALGESGPNTFETFFDAGIDAAASFLQQTAQLILQQLIQLAVAKALLGLGIGGPAAGGGGGVLGLAEGGPVPGRGGHGVPIPRPVGLHPSDTVAAWLAPGEHVQPVKTVQTYGADLFEAFRRGIIDPAAARALMGSSKLRSMRVRASKGPGFQTGGLVGEQLSSLQSSLSAIGSSSASTGDQRQTIAAVPVREEELDRMRNSDAFDRVMLDWHDRNATEVDGINRAGRR